MTSASEKINLTFFSERTHPLCVNIHALCKVRGAMMIPDVITLIYGIVSASPPIVSTTLRLLQGGICWQSHTRCGWEELLRWEFRASEAIRRMWTLSIGMCALPALLLEYFTDMHRTSLLMDHLSWHNGAHIVKRQKCWWFFFFPFGF